MTRPTVLVVDDDADARNYLARFLGTRGYQVECADSGERALARLSAPARPAVLILDLVMPKVDGLEVLSEMEKRGERVPTIVLSGVGQVNTVVQAVRMGASDYLLKPFEEEDLERAVSNALNPHASPAGESNEIISHNEQLNRIREIAAQVADTDIPVLILGDSGVGKEVLARFIHETSDRRKHPFVKVNCAALPLDLLESELFGYERGAFTGAMRDKPGKFELAGQGTIFLDEIGEMSPQLQAKLLHVLQDGEYTRLGGSKPSRAQARVLAATNQRLETALAKGTFRPDLYFRLSVVRLEIPPLRERREDILALSQNFLEKYAVQYRRPLRPLPLEMQDALVRYSWPGNVRQLENIIKRFVVLPDPQAALADLREFPTAAAEDHAGPKVPLPLLEEEAGESNISLKKVSAEAAERAEKEIVLRTLEELNWNRKQAARQLDISYKALLNKLRRWEIGQKTKRTDIH